MVIQNLYQIILKFISLLTSEEWLNCGGCTGCNNTAPKKKIAHLKEYENKFILFVLPLFNFCPDIEKSDYVPQARNQEFSRAGEFSWN